MARLIQFVVLSAILAVTYCQPERFGVEIGGKSTVEIGAEPSLTSTKDRGLLARLKGFFNWAGSVNGGANVDDTGFKAEAGSSVRGNVDGEIDVNNGEVKTRVSKEGKANVFLDISPYDAKTKASNENYEVNNQKQW